MGAAWVGAMCPQPTCLRTMAAYLVSTKPLSPLLRGRLLPLLDGGHSAIAGRLAGALRRVGHAEQAGEILSTMKVAGYDVRESEPFEVTQRVFAKRGATEAPIVARL